MSTSLGLCETDGVQAVKHEFLEDKMDDGAVGVCRLDTFGFEEQRRPRCHVLACCSWRQAMSVLFVMWDVQQ